MIKRIKIIGSLFCIVFSVVLALTCIFVQDGDKVLTQAIASNKAKSKTVLLENAEDEKTTEIIKEDVISENDTNENNGSIDNLDNNELEEVTTVEDVSAEPKVYEGMTLNELANKLDRSLKNELHGKGYLYASYSLEKGVDPYLAAAISLEETGCNWNCSNLVKSCNNVGGMKGSGCGSYGAFGTLDNGIKAFIDNIARNYVAYGLTTANLMNPKYAENPAWSTNVNNYINRIRNN